MLNKVTLLIFLCATFVVPQETGTNLFIGKFKLTESENFDDYMKALGVGFFLRKIGNSLTPTVTITKDGDVYTMKTESTLKTTEITFKLGEEFEQETMFGEKVKTIITADGNNLTEVDKGVKEVTIVSEFSDKGFKEVTKVDDIVSTRFYERI